MGKEEGESCLKWFEVIIGCETETYAHRDSGTVKNALFFYVAHGANLFTLKLKPDIHYIVYI